MSDTPDSTDEPHPKSKKPNLTDLLPAKAAVETSLGPLYVRHAYTSDWKHFERDDALELGRVVLQQLCSRIEDRKDSRPLEDADFQALVEADFNSLVAVIAKKNDWNEIPTNAGLKELGSAAKKGKDHHLELHKKFLADMHKSIGMSYRFLENGVLNKLQAQMAGLVDIQSGVKSNGEILRAAVRESSSPIDKFKRTVEQMNTTQMAMPDVRNSSVISSFEVAPKRNPLDLIPNRPEDTPLGRATLESANNSREVALNMVGLVDVITGLNQTVIQDVLPAWVKQVETNQKDAKEAFKQAANSLWWAKWAVLASVLVTVLATWWQVSVAREIDRENTEQQRRVEAILGKQLAAQQKLIEQQASDASAMREAIMLRKSLATMAMPMK